MAQAQSTAAGSSGQAQATAQTNVGNFNLVQTTATSQVGGTSPGTAVAQAGGIISLFNPVIPAQSFSVASGFALGPLTFAYGAMGAGGMGSSLTYQESASFAFNSGTFLLDLLDNTSLGTGFDSAEFQIFLNGNLFDSQSFPSLAVAQAFFSNNLIDIPTGVGPSNVQLVFDETMSSDEGFNFDYAIVSATPLPSSWTMMLIGLAGLGFVGYRGARSGSAAITAA